MGCIDLVGPFYIASYSESLYAGVRPMYEVTGAAVTGKGIVGGDAERQILAATNITALPI